MAFARNRQTKPFVEQWARTGRWLERLREAYGSSETDAPADEVMDLFYAFFQNCFAMRDWLIASGVDEKIVMELFQSETLQLCRDVANGTKHCEIQRCRASVDAAFMTVREYDPFSARSEAFRLLAGGHKYDLFALVLRCVDEIQDFLIRENLMLQRSELLAKELKAKG